MADENPTRTLAALFTWRSAIADSELKPTIRHVLLTLSCYMNERGGSAYPGSTRLAHDTGLHVTTVKEALASAVKEGYLIVVQKGGSPSGGKRLATEYRASSPLADWFSVDRGSTTTGSSERVDRGSSPRGPGVQDDPISSVITSENSRPPKDCVRCHGDGSYWDGMKQRDCEHVFTEGSVPPPWVQAGQSFADWSGRESIAESETA